MHVGAATSVRSEEVGGREGAEGQRTSLERMAKSPLFAQGRRCGSRGRSEEGSERQHGLMKGQRTWNQKTWFLDPAP